MAYGVVSSTQHFLQAFIRNCAGLCLPDGINGVMEYYWDRKPTVKIDARLTQQHWREPRLRTTLCQVVLVHAEQLRKLAPISPG